MHDDSTSWIGMRIFGISEIRNNKDARMPKISLIREIRS